MASPPLFTGTYWWLIKSWLHLFVISLLFAGVASPVQSFVNASVAHYNSCAFWFRRWILLSIFRAFFWTRSIIYVTRLFCVAVCCRSCCLYQCGRFPGKARLQNDPICREGLLSWLIGQKYSVATVRICYNFVTLQESITIKFNALWFPFAFSFPLKKLCQFEFPVTNIWLRRPVCSL